MQEHRTRFDAIKARIYTKEVLARKIYLWRMLGQKIVFTNGCFDLLHRGHVEYLAKAVDLGNVLIVGVNADSSYKKLGKSPNRPLQDEQSRALILASLNVVEAVLIFEEDTPLELIQFIQPDVLVKGGDYDANETDPKNKKYIVGSDIVKARGGEVKTIELLAGFSSTAIEEKVRKG